MLTLNLNGEQLTGRYDAGTVMPFYNMAEVREDIACVAVNAGRGIKAGTEASIIKVADGKVTYVTRGKQKQLLPIGDFVKIFQRRRGPVVSESIRPGLVAKAVSAGNGFLSGGVVTFVETSGSVYGVETKAKGKGSVKANEVSLYFEYV